MKRIFESSAAAIGFAAALYPLGQWYFRRLADGGDEPLGLVALATALLLAQRERNQLTAARSIAVIMLAIYGLSVWLGLPPLIRAIPALIALAAWSGIWHRPPLLALLFLSLPVISSLQFYAGYPLRIIVTHFAQVFLGLLGVTVTFSGAELIHEGVVVGVDPPCSGVRMLWVSSFLAAAFAARVQLGWKATAVLGGSAVFLAILANALRATVLFFPESGLVHWPHWTHEFTGIALFTATGSILLFAANRLQR